MNLFTPFYTTTLLSTILNQYLPRTKDTIAITHKIIHRYYVHALRLMVKTKEVKSKDIL